MCIVGISPVEQTDTSEVEHVAVLNTVGMVDFLNAHAVRRFAVINGSTSSQSSRYSARQFTARNVDVNDAQTTNIKLSFLLPQQSYRVGVAAKTRAGVGAFSEIVFDTRSFNARTYSHRDVARNLQRGQTRGYGGR